MQRFTVLFHFIVITTLNWTINTDNHVLPKFFLGAEKNERNSISVMVFAVVTGEDKVMSLLFNELRLINTRVYLMVLYNCFAALNLNKLWRCCESDAHYRLCSSYWSKSIWTCTEKESILDCLKRRLANRISIYPCF